MSFGLPDEVTNFLENVGVPGPEQNDDYRLEIAYRIGYRDALTNYAIWRDGEQRIGCMEKRVKDILQEFKNKQVPLRY